MILPSLHATSSEPGVVFEEFLSYGSNPHHLIGLQQVVLFNVGKVQQSAKAIFGKRYQEA